MLTCQFIYWTFLDVPEVWYSNTLHNFKSFSHKQMLNPKDYLGYQCFEQYVYNVWTEWTVIKAF